MPPEEPATDTSYDRIPYPSWPYAQSHPDRLASIAILLGQDPPAIARARVLELGCASGGNLIPMAAMFPESTFLGIDMSARQIEEGDARIHRLGLHNIRLEQQDILEFPLTGPPFDYIISHGVFSWVPSHVQDRMLRICQERLHERGVAYVSYNTFPGWRMRGMIRDMLIYHASQFREPEKQIHQARALLQFLANSVSTDTPYGAFLKQEVDIFQHVSDEYVFHDHLEGVNDPVYFHEFMARAQENGLQYLGEPQLNTMATSSFASEVEETLHRISKDVIQVEQYMDFLKNRSFRQTLLCRDTATIDRSLAPDHVTRLWFSSPLQRHDETDDAQQPVIAFRYKGVRVTSENTTLRAALELLGQRWPHWVSFADLLRHCQLQSGIGLGGESPSVNVRVELAEHLIRCYGRSLINIHSDVPRFAANVSESPATTELTREQIVEGHKVTNLRHEVVKLNDVARFVVGILDGKTSVESLRQTFIEQVKSGKLTLPESQQSHLLENVEAECQSVIDATLAHLCDVALLVR